MRESYIDLGIIISALVVGIVFWRVEVVSWFCLGVGLATGYHAFMKMRLVQKIVAGERQKFKEDARNAKQLHKSRA